MYMHVFLSAFLAQIRAHTYCCGTVTVALRSPAPAPVSALSPRGRYGKFVAQQLNRRQIAKFNQIRFARPISAQPAPATWTGTPRLCHGNLGNNGAAKSR
jgi:hypothetical protein